MYIWYMVCLLLTLGKYTNRQCAYTVIDKVVPNTESWMFPVLFHVCNEIRHGDRKSGDMCFCSSSMNKSPFLGHTFLIYKIKGLRLDASKCPFLWLTWSILWSLRLKIRKWGGFIYDQFLKEHFKLFFY